MRLSHAWGAETEITKQVARIRAAPALILLLDYDGTLVPFAPRPEMAAPDREVLQLLRRLARRRATDVHLVSGRPPRVMQSWFGAMPVGLHAEHGLWSRSLSGGEWRCRPAPPLPYDELLGMLEWATRETQGSLIELKSNGLAWHWRRASVDAGRAMADVLVGQARQWFPPQSVAVLRGDKVLEFRPAGINKGDIVAALRREHGSGALLVAVGDDTTDEDMFAALPAGALSIQVGLRARGATLRLPDVAACRAFLERIAEA
jgi:trehalose 6-phosphate synthase/phosphatase